MIHISDLVIGPDERAALNRVIDRAWINEGPEVRAFEEELASWLGVKHVVAVSSGTAALMCGLTAMQLDPRWHISRVLVPALTFVSTVNSVALCGLTPIFADINSRTFCLDPSTIWDRHDVALPVHLFGFPVDLAALRKKTNTPIVEDACEAHGSTIGGQRVGSFGLWSATSFHAAHTMQAGELGAFCTDDANLARIVRRLKAHGRECACAVCTRNTTGCPIMDRDGYDPRFRCLYPGFNFKPMEFPAALARVQLTKVEENISRRQENVALLDHLLDGVSELRLPRFPETAVPMVYPLILTLEGIRDRVTTELTKLGIETRPLFGSIPTQQPAYARSTADRFPVADYVGANGFYVGCHQYLTQESIREIAGAILRVLKEL